MKKTKSILIILSVLLFLGCMDHAQMDHHEDIVRVTINTEGDPVKGNTDAPVTLIAFEDFQCGYCKAFNLEILPQMKGLFDEGKVKLVYKDLPIVSKHPMAQKAAEAALCARMQGKFWEYHDIIYERQKELSVENLKIWAQELKLDGLAFDECLDSGAKEQEVLADLELGKSLGVSATPTVYVNGRKISGLVELDEYFHFIEEELQN